LLGSKPFALPHPKNYSLIFNALKGYRSCSATFLF
jgi:hypothetical protein